MTEKKHVRPALFNLKRCVRIVFFALALLAMIILAVSWFGPVLLERILTDWMEQAGIESPQLRVQSINPRGVCLSDIQAQKGRLKVDFLSIHFSPSGLMRGRVDRIAISGLSWHIAIRDGKADLGLPELKVGEPRQNPPRLPFDSLILNSSSIIIAHDGAFLTIPFSINLEPVGENILGLAARFEPLGFPVVVHGEGNPASGEARLYGRISGQLAKIENDPEAGVQNSGLAGAVDLNLQWHREPNHAQWGSFEITAQAKGLILNALGLLARLKKGSLAIQGALDENLRFETLDGDLRVEGLRFQEYELESLNLTLDGQGAASALSARIDRPFEAVVSIQGSHPSIPELLKNGGAIFGRLNWVIEGTLPKALISRYSSDTVAAVGNLPFQASGFIDADALEWPRWNFDARIEKSRAGPLSMVLASQNLRLEDAFVNAVGRFRFDGRTLSGSLDGGTVLGVKKIIRKDDAVPVIVDAVELVFRKNRPLASFSMDSNGSMEIIAAAAFRKPVTVRAQKMKFRAGTLGVEGRAFLDGKGQPRWQVRVALGDGVLEAPKIAARAEKISLDLPLTFGAALPERGRFSIGQVSYDRIDLPGPSGRIGIHNNRLQVDGTWNVLSLSPLRFQADLDLNDSALKGRLEANADWFEMPDRADLNRLASELGDLNLTGQARIKIGFDIEGPLLTPNLEIFLRNMAVANRRQELELTGLSGSVRIDRLDPLSTPGNQTLYFNRLRLGAFEVEKGLMAFRLEDPAHLFLEKIRLSLPQGGTIALQSARIDLGKSVSQAEVLLENIDLISLLAHLTNGKIDGSGRVYGRIPLSYDAGKIRLDSGYVYSVPGTGRLGIRDEDWLKTLMFYVNEAMAGHPYLSLVSERMEQALRNFQYHHLSVDFNKAGAETAARVELRGRGVEGDPPQEIGSLVLNLNDLEELINRVLGFKMTSEESIDRALEDLLDFQ